VDHHLTALTYTLEAVAVAQVLLVLTLHILSPEMVVQV
jgi:hypothetical protein